MKTRSHPEDVAEDLRERARRGDLTLGKAELKRIAAILDKLSYRCAEAYQVVGDLANSAGVFGHRSVMKALDLLSDPLRRGDILPFKTPNDQAQIACDRRPVTAKAAAKTSRKKRRR